MNIGMQNLITSSPWIWGCLLAAMVVLPILIHLINRLRHQPIRWAAMDFLLASHKNNRNQVWLRQLLLLLARIATMLLILLTIGQVSCQNSGLARLTGTHTTHHYVLIDDSLSMNEINDGQSPIQRAGEVVTQLANRIVGRENHRVTVIRFSQVLRFPQVSGGTERAGSTSPLGKNTLGEEGLFDMNGQVVDRAAEKTLQQLAVNLRATSLALDPQPSLGVAMRLVQERPNESAVVYLLSDYRSVNWNRVSSDGKLAESLAALENAGANVNLIRCAEQTNANLAIVGLRPVSNITVAGVPAMMEVKVKNFGDVDSRRVQVRLQAAVYAGDRTSMTPEAIEPETIELSSVLIDKVAAGETASRRFPVFFNRTGQHSVQASLPDDPLMNDNHRWSVTQFESSKKVLMVDGSTDRSGQFLALALSAGNLTGLTVEQAKKSMLRDITSEKLNEFEAVFLLDVDQLDETAIARLEEFAGQGGGVVFFLGPRVSASHYRNMLYRDGKGIFPLPLSKIESVDESLEPGTADFVVSRHPVFDSVSNVENSPLNLVQLQKAWATDVEWNSEDHPSVNTLAFIRGDRSRPLVIEKQFGEGTVMAFTTTCGPAWNNWMKNPTFPPTALLLQNYVSKGRVKLIDRVVGWSRDFSLSVVEYEPKVTFVAANSDDGFARTVWNVTATNASSSESASAKSLVASLGNDVNETAAPGIYETWLTRRDQTRELNRFALNVDQVESDLVIANRREVQKAVAGTAAAVIDWDAFAMTSTRSRGSSLLRWLLVGLILFFIAEQFLAWMNSYHPR